MKVLLIASLGMLSLTQTSLSFADNANGKISIYSDAACAMEWISKQQDRWLKK